MNFTFQQKLATAVGIVGAGTAAFQALGPLMTSTQTLIGGVAFGFITACLGVVGTVTNTQNAQVQQVVAMPGVETITVNNKATPALATMAIDSTQAKVGPANGNRPQLEEIAKS